MFRKKSTWERLTEPVSGAVGQPPVKSGLAAVGTASGHDRGERGGVRPAPTRRDPLMLGRLAVFGVGYVIGTRAGRERYETIRVAATALAARLEDYSRGDRGSAPTTRP